MDKFRYFYIMNGWKKKLGNRSLNSLSIGEVRKVFASFKCHDYWDKLRKSSLFKDMSLVMDDILLNGWPAPHRPSLLKSKEVVLSVSAWGLILTANGPWGVLSVAHDKFDPAKNLMRRNEYLDSAHARELHQHTPQLSTAAFLF